MTPSEIHGTLTEVFRDVFDDDSLTIHDEMTAKDVEKWDSLTHIDLIVAVEKRFRIKLTTRDVAGMKNVGHLLRLVEQRTAARAVT